MRKKAQLDILDLPVHEEESSPNLEKGSTISEKKGLSPRERSFPWFVLCMIILVAILGTVWYFVSQNPAETGKKESIVATAPELSVGRLNMDELFVPVHDDQRNLRLMLCSFILEVDPPRYMEISQRQRDIRTFMYETIARHTVSELLDPQGKRSLKKELYVGLESILGKDVLRALYVDKYIIL